MIELLFTLDPAAAVLVTISIAFAFQASLATAIFLKALPWKRLLTCYLVAAIGVPLLFVIPALGKDSLFNILDGWVFVSARIFIGCWIGTAPVALVLLGIDLWRGGKPAPDAEGN